MNYRYYTLTLLTIMAFGAGHLRAAEKTKQAEKEILVQAPDGNEAFFPADTTVKIVSQEGTVFEVPLAVARYSATIGSLVIDAGIESPISLQNITSQALQHFIKLAEHLPSTEPRAFSTLSKKDFFNGHEGLELKDFFNRFQELVQEDLKNLKPAALFNLINAANYLDNTFILNAALSNLAGRMRPEQRALAVRLLLGKIEDAEEEQEIRKSLKKSGIDLATIPGDLQRSLAFILLNVPAEMVLSDVQEQLLDIIIDGAVSAPNEELYTLLITYTYTKEDLPNNFFLAMVRFLLQSGANINEITEEQMRFLGSNDPLSWAINNEMTELVELFLEFGADSNRGSAITMRILLKSL